IIFYSRTALEQMAPVATVLRTQVKSFEFKSQTKDIYKTASAGYQNADQKQLIAAGYSDSTAPTADDRSVITRIEKPDAATLKAQSALHDKNKDQFTSRIEAEGTVLLVAGVNITIQGFGAFDGKWHVMSSRHRLERSSGYTTEIEAREIL
ncbi:MAG: hypothetical protein JOZ29_15660, partial [Deltaproteobacteria bacterium]|nr:hypothetical protein [Deltaproteobacteria bacterium]